MLSMCAKTQLNEDNFTLVKGIHATLIIIQTILAIRQETNPSLVFFTSSYQKKHVPLAILVWLKVAPKGKAVIVILLMNTLALYVY